MERDVLVWFDRVILAIGRFWRALGLFVLRYLGAFLTLVGGGLVALAPLTTSANVNGWVITAVIVGVGLSATVAIGQDVLIRSLRKDVSAAGEVVRGEEAVAVRDILYRAIERLESLRKRAGNSQSRDKIDGKYESLVETVVGGLKGYFDEPGVSVTVNYYRLCKAGDHYSLRVPDGTFQVSRPVLSMDDPEGLEIVSRTLRGESEYCHDILDRELPEGVPNERQYRCFVSGPAAVDGQIHGMVSMNTATPGGLNEQRAKAYLMAFGTILASAESAFGQSTPHVKGETFSIPQTESTLTGHAVSADAQSNSPGGA